MPINWSKYGVGNDREEEEQQRSTVSRIDWGKYDPANVQKQEGERYVNQMRSAPQLLNPFEVQKNITSRFAPEKTEALRTSAVEQRQQDAENSGLGRLVQGGVDLITSAADRVGDMFPGLRDSKVNESLANDIQGVMDHRMKSQRAIANTDIGAFIQGAGDAATLGLTSFGERMLGNPDVAERITQSGPGKAGQLAGQFLLPAGRLKAGASLLSNVGRGAAAGAALGTGIEAGEYLTGRNDESFGKRLLDVGLSGAFGGIGAGVAEGIGRGIDAVRGTAQRAAQDVVGRDLEAFGVLENAQKNADLTRYTTQRLNDIDEQISSLNARPLKDATFNDEMQSLVNERAETMRFLNSVDPSYQNAAVMSPAMRSVEETTIPGINVNQGTTGPAAKVTAAPKVSAQKVSNKPGERAFNMRVRQTEGISPGLQQGLMDSPDRFYRRVTNKGAVATANRRIERQGVMETAKKLMSKTKFDDRDLATGMRSLQELDKQGDHEAAVAMASKMAKELTKAGQLIQAASIWNRLSPEGALLFIQRQAEKVGNKVTPEDASEIMSVAGAAQKAGASVERSNEIMDISEKLIKKEELTPEEMAKISTFVDDMSKLVKPPKATKTAKQPKLPSEKKVREQLLASLNDKEAQLKAFIQQNSRRISANPVDVWGAYAALGAIKLAKGAISFSKWSEEMIRDVGEHVRPHLSKLFDDAQVESEQFEHLMPPPNAAQKVAKRYIDMNRLTPADGYKIHRLASDMGKLSTRDKQAASRQMQEILNRYEKSTIGDKVNALRYIAMLANTSTQIVNAMSSPLMVLERYILDMIQTPFDAIRSKLTGGQRQVTFKQGPDAWNNFFTPVSDYYNGLKTGASAGWKGIDPEGITSAHEARGLAFKSKWDPVRYIEGTLGAVMKGFDYASYNAATQMRMRQMAYLDAINKGVKDKAEIKRYMDRYLNNVDANIVDLADMFGKEMTFQQDSILATAGKMVQRGLNLDVKGLTGRTNFSPKTGLGSAVLPFVKTPANILVAGLERTPAGLLKGLYDLATMRSRNISGRDVAATIAKSIYGVVGLSGTGYVLGNLGIITGDSSSKSKDVQALEESIGQGKFKFNSTAFSRMMEALISGDIQDIEEVSKYREGDKLLNYNKLQPFAFPVAMGATFAGQQERAKAAEAIGQNIPLTDQLIATAGAGAQSIYDMSMLKGLQDLFDVQPGEGVLDMGTQLAANYVKSFSPSALGQEARRQDEYQRQVSYKGFKEPVQQYFQSRFPGQSQNLPPRVTNLGDVKRNEQGIIGNYLNPLQSSAGTYNDAAKIIYDTIQATGDEKLAPTPMDKTIRGKKKGVSTTETIEPNRYAQLMQDVGAEITKRILALPKELSPEKRATRIEEIYSDVREKERDKLKREMGFTVQ